MLRKFSYIFKFQPWKKLFLFVLFLISLNLNRTTSLRQTTLLNRLNNFRIFKIWKFFWASHLLKILLLFLLINKKFFNRALISKIINMNCLSFAFLIKFFFCSIPQNFSKSAIWIRMISVLIIFKFAWITRIICCH